MGVGSSGEVFVEQRRSEGSPEKTGKVSLVPEDELERGKLFHDGCKCRPGRSGGDEEGHGTLSEAEVDGQQRPREGREVRVMQTRVDGDWELERSTEGFRRCRRKAVLVGRQLGNFLQSEVAQSYPTLCDPMDCSPPGSSVHRIFQARVLEWVAISVLKATLERDAVHLNSRVTLCLL